MKVLHLSAEKTWRGGEQQIAYLIEKSATLGVEILVACQRASAFEDYCIRQEVPHLSLSFRSLAGISAARSIKKICVTESIDLIHAHSSHAHGPAVISSALGNPTPVILSRKVIIPLKKKITTRWKYNHSCIKKIICVSDAVAEVLRPAIESPERLVTVHDGIDLTRFQNLQTSERIRKEFNIPDHAPVILNIAALSHDKDLFTFIRTAKKVVQKFPETRFLIAGSGPLKSELEAEIQASGLTGKVILIGFRDDIPELLKQCDLFLSTSQSEGLGSSILDAFATNTPVVATDAGGIPELIQHRKNGLLSPVADHDALASCVTELIGDPELANKLGKNGHELVVERFTTSTMAKKTISHYRDLLQHHA
ncbi:glycosyltransferase family 4 protein [Akkermansiaceae bacterium]|nr:glycosyltransferase family 4 protein [Akkermansiaceae bacterium]MDB4386854.1 glycosyltransferase family 4 protein [Akkermansiaceae bacterium]